MDKLTPDLLKMYRRKAVTPVIIEAKPGLFESVRSQLKSIVPISLLEAKFHTFLPRITPLIEFPLTKWKEIKTFSMIATVLTPELIEEVAQWRDVQRIYPDYIKWALSTVPPQGVFKDYKGKPFTSTFWTKKMMGLDRANAKGFTGKGITTVVIDSGARITHEQLRGRVRSLTAAPEKGMSGEDSNGHGTYCNSVVGGRYAIDRRYKAPVEGMAPDCNLISIQALGFIVGMGCSSDIIKAMELSIGLDAKCVSMSLGSDDAPKDEDNPEAKAINKLVEAGIIPCVAAGNAGPNPSTVGSPGSCLNSLTVAAWDELEGKVADFSSRGPTAGDGYIKPDVAAPGVRINSALVGFLDGITDPSQPHYGPISGTCLVRDVNIYTPDGPVELGDLKIGDAVYSYSFDGMATIGKVVNIIDQGVKEIYEVTTGDGRKLVATGNHPILAGKSDRVPYWRRVDQLTRNHELVIPGLNPLPAQELDELISVEIAKTLGYFLADGWITRTKRRHQNWQVCTSLDGEWFFKTFGIPCKPYEKNWLYTYSKRLALALTLLGFGQPHKKARLPRWVYHLSREKIKAFIDGFAKGDAHIDGLGGYWFELASEWLVRDLKYLCDWAGYKAYGVKYRERLNKPPHSKNAKIWKSWQVYINPAYMPRFTRVKKVERIGEDRVFDITVEPYPHFIAEGLVVHNSMATPHCAGLVTCMAQLYREKIGRELTVDEVKRMMEKLGPNQPKDTNVGWGLITWDIVEQWVSTEYGVAV
jgi:hypothetical protein